MNPLGEIGASTEANGKEEPFASTRFVSTHTELAGDNSARLDSARSDSKAGGTASIAPSYFDPEQPVPGALPLRLSVGHGGLGLELSAPMTFGPLTVEDFEVALVGVKYPVDLSKGVKEFRNRRSRLVRIVAQVDLTGLVRPWQVALEPLWGSPVVVRIRPRVEEEGDSSSGSSSSTSEDPASNESAVSGLAITISSHDAVLAFDLLLASGTAPRFIVDAPRLLGRDDLALALALQCIDLGLKSGGSGLDGWGRNGRIVDIQGFAGALALAVLPPLGCRLPIVQDQVVHEVTVASGSLRLVLGLNEEPFLSGRRALGAGAVASFLNSADSLLAQGKLTDARALYLEALSSAPGHPEALLQLADLDALGGTSSEAALSFLQELDGSLSSTTGGATRLRYYLILERVLDQMNKKDSAREALFKAGDYEADALVLSWISMKKSDWASTSSLKVKYLDEALQFAPYSPRPREKRFLLAVAQGHWAEANRDAERLEAFKNSSEEKSHLARWIGETFVEYGHLELAQSWHRRALRFSPTNRKNIGTLARVLALSGELHRAAELYQRALELANGVKDPLAHNEQTIEEITEYRLSLALIFSQSRGEQFQSLALLSSIESRGANGAKGRLMEAIILEQSERPEQSIHALTRLLEAIELGWISVDEARQLGPLLIGTTVVQLGEYMANLIAHPDSELAAFAQNILRER